MRSRRSIRALCLVGAAGVGVCALAAGPARTAPSRDYVARLDGAPVTAAGLDGRTWSAWSYRGMGEFDIAIAVRALDGTWSPVTFLGRLDGIDQIEPSITLDADGNVYVAFATRSPQRIWTSVLPAGQSTWSEPSVVTLDESAGAPALRIVRDRLVIGYRTPGGVRVVDLPVYVAPNSTEGVQDGPDTTGPLGNDGRELPTGDDDDDEPPPPSDNGESSNS